MVSLEELVSSLSARLKLLEDENEILKIDAQESRAIANRAMLEHTLQASRYDTDRKMIAMLGTLLTGNALAWYNPYLEKPRSIPFYHGLSSEIKDALVHFDNPSSVSAAMDMAIRIDNRYLNDARNNDSRIRDPLPVFFSNSSHFSL
ncbi:hypothetical protein BASA62_001948 [Batrachochytrium salamandrivorans]|nr:hypothetical protein BASA62_001948 [Batrachochytrium salamandrivorans]